MKKQNVNNKLAFGKATVAELNHKQMHEVNGGSTFKCFGPLVDDLITWLTGTKY